MASEQFFGPGTDEYIHGTQPDNSSGQQHPTFVAAPTSEQEVSAIIVEAARRGLVIVPQATGHGAGGDIGAGTVIMDTSSLGALTIDAERRTASVGAGVTWGRVDSAAEHHGLLGLAGSSPTVSVAGFTFGGGLGWLTRPHGMASSALRRVEYVDDAGTIRVAAEDAPNPADQEALWAFRGGGGVGVATNLELDLVSVADLHAGYLLWPVDVLDAVVGAWADSLPSNGDDVATSISVLHLPPAPQFPAQLRGKRVVHLALAASTGEVGALGLLAAVRAAATPVTDTWGPANAAKLGGIHLDPPGAAPAIGDARWLTDGTPAGAAAVLSIAASGDSPLELIELRNFDNEAPARPGAETVVPAPFVVHAVGAVGPPDARPKIERAFSELREVTATVDAGRSVGSWMEGATSVPDALPTELTERVRRVADAVDPGQVIRRSRYLS